MEEMKTKECTKCKEVLPIDMFAKAGSGYRRGACKVCNKSIASGYYQKSKQRAKTDDDWYWRQRIKWYNTPNQRRSAHVNALISATKLDYVEVKKMYDSNPHCTYCGVHITKEDTVLDHAVPLSRGGANSIDNINISCGDCNTLKSDRTADEFIEFMQRYIQRWSR